MHLLQKVASFLGPSMEDNLKNVRDEAIKLVRMWIAGLPLRIEEAENNSSVALREVKSRSGKVSAIKAKMDEIETEITTIQNGDFSQSLHRRSLSKNLKMIAEDMKELQKSCVFESISAGSALEFESRKHVEDGIMASLRDAEVYKVGIWGMAGVGKTTMAKKIMHRVRQERLFEEIVIVVVSQNADMLRIQDDIATSLGLKLEGKSQPSRAHLLRTRLSDGAKRSLIIVDDIWEDLNLDDLGIPCGSHCKVLVTSRNTDVFKKMDVEEVHGVNLLTEAEAWHFFQLNAGNCAGHPNVVSVAEQVVKECKGLPIALETVGRSLKGTENRYIWEDSLQQLRSSNPSDMPDVLNDVYKPLRLSYEFLHNKQIQSLFLMCCLYPEDGDIPIEDLAINAIGLGIFDEIKRLKDKRNRVYSLVKTLKSRSLLLEGFDEDCVTMHDVVRDVAVFIASDKKLIAAHSESNDYTWISPYIRETTGLRGGLADHPNLRLLWIGRYSRDKEVKIQDYTFEGMKELHLLSIQFSPVMQLPITMMLLENLRTLVLKECESLKSISVVGELVNLEILICQGCVLIESLPVEIGRLSGLKLLELSKCRKLKKIPPGIISKLKELEELIVWKCFHGWEAKNMGRENKNALLSELEHLSNLRLLKIEVKDSRLAAEQMRLSPKLLTYHIRIGDLKMDYLDDILSVKYERKMELMLPGNISLGEWIYELVKGVEHMHLQGDGSGLDFGVSHNMRVLLFCDCSTVKKLMSAKTVATVFPLLETLHLENLVALKEISDIDGPMSSNSFNNLQDLKLLNLPGLEHLNILSNFNMLSSLYVSGCDKLSAIMTTGSSIVQLKSLHISFCEMMEQVLLWDEEEDEIVFQNLEELELIHLPNLTSFSKGIESIGFPVLEDATVAGCTLMKRFVWTTFADDDNDHGDGDWMRILNKSLKFELGSLRKVEVGGYSGSMCRNWCPMIIAIFSRLSELRVVEIFKMKSLFPYSVAQNLHNLRLLYIGSCNDMVGVIEDDACGGQTPPTPTPTPLLPNLKYITLDLLPKLKSFCECKHALEFPSLTTLRIQKCDSMEEFTSGHVSTPFLPHIQTGYGDGDIFNINNDVNASLKQQREEHSMWLEGSSLQENMKVSIEIMEDHNSQEEEEEGMMSSDDDGVQIEEVENVDKTHSESKAEELRKPYEFQSETRRRIETEKEHNSQLKGEEEEESSVTGGDKTQEVEKEAEESLDEDFVKRSSEKPMEDEDRVYVVPERCIEHCRLFIPDCEFDKAKLVRMWIADECIESGGAERLEDVGSFYFDALVHNKVIVASRFDNLHRQTKYTFDTSQLSDGILKRGDYVSINASKLDEISREASHLTWQCEKIDRTLFDSVKDLKRLHTLVVREYSPSMSELPGEIFLGLELLKSLDLSRTNISELPGSVGKLKSLRYLDVSETPIKRLPESLDRLDCLETLNLNACFSLFDLPRGLGRLINLRHLDLDIANQLKYMPRGMGNLTKLQTLRGFIVEKNDGCSIRELKNMNDITWSFCILRLENVSNVEEAKEAALCDKKYIEKLELRWRNCGNEDTSEILEFLKPNYNLKELRLINYGGSKLPRWISNPSYVDLVNITLCKCVNCDIMPSVGELPSLKILYIMDMENLRSINTFFCRNHETKTLNAFPRLEKLTLDSMPALEEWTGVEDGDFLCLAHISISYCPKLRVLPSLSNLHSLEHLEINDCSQLTSLPEGSLPESLESLIISGCPELGERCRQDGGQDWSKIAFVKCIWIDSENISHNIQKATFNGGMPKSYASLPEPLKTLCDCLNGLSEGRGIQIALDDDVFYNNCEIYIHLDDFTPFCDLEPITEKCMIVYIWHLYNKMKIENTLRRFQFVNPFAMSYEHNSQSDMRASALADSFNFTSPNQLVLVPCNVGEHWILTIIEPYKEVIWSLDPIGHNINEPWKDVVNMAISKFNDNLGKKGKEQPTWRVIKAPLQPDFKHSGYYVMCYMKDIVQGLKTVDSGSLSSLFVKEYTLNEIDDVRTEWAVCMQKYLPISIN